MSRFLVSLLGFAALLPCLTACSAERRTTSPPKNPLYTTAADDVYLQEIGRKISTDRSVTALGATQQDLYAISDKKLMKRAGGALQPVANAPNDMQRLFV